MFRANGAREGAKPKAKAEAKGGGGGGMGMDDDHDQGQEVSGAKGAQHHEMHGGGGGGGGGGDDSAIDSDIEEDLGNDSPVKVPQKGGGGGYAAAKHPSSAPIRGEEKKPIASNSTSEMNRPSAKGVAGMTITCPLHPSIHPSIYPS